MMSKTKTELATELRELKHEHKVLRIHYDRSSDLAGKLVDALERLGSRTAAQKKIIDKLPKCWRMNDAKDGLVQDVPVVFGGKILLWTICRGQIVEKNIYLLDHIKLCYDSREAAEFALKQAGR